MQQGDKNALAIMMRAMSYLVRKFKGKMLQLKCRPVGFVLT